MNIFQSIGNIYFFSASTSTNVFRLLFSIGTSPGPWNLTVCRGWELNASTERVFENIFFYRVSVLSASTSCTMHCLLETVAEFICIFIGNSVSTFGLQQVIGYCKASELLAKLIIFLYLQPHYVTKLDGAQKCKDEKDNNYCTAMMVILINYL